MTAPRQTKGYQPSVYKDKGGNREVFDDGSTLLYVQGMTHLSTKGVGVSPAGNTKTTLVENVGQVHHSVFTLVNQTVAMLDATTNGSQGKLELYDFPAGNILILGAECNVAIQASGTPGLIAGALLVASIGTAVPGVDVTLTGTEANIIASTAATLTAYAGAFAGRALAPAVYDGVVAAIKAYLNFDAPDASSSGNDTLTLNGTINLIWVQLGAN